MLIFVGETFILIKIFDYNVTKKQFLKKLPEISLIIKFSFFSLDLRFMINH